MLIAVAAGDSREKETVAKRSEPDGTGAGGVISATRPYGYEMSVMAFVVVKSRQDTHPEQGIEHFLRDVRSVELHP